MVDKCRRGDWEIRDDIFEDVVGAVDGENPSGENPSGENPIRRKFQWRKAQFYKI